MNVDAPSVISAAYRLGMFGRGDVVLAAVSGGVDSVVMLDALIKASGDLGISLHIAHLNHHIRPGEAEADAEFVESLADRYGLPVTIGDADVPKLASQHRTGLEEAGRNARYDFLHATANQMGATRIALGHTADDRAEGVLMNLIRGCGPDGIVSIAPVRGSIVRPLISTFRTEIEQYAQLNGLEYRNDSTNLDTSYTRNRIRHDLLPLLEKTFNPSVKQALLRLAELAARDRDYLSLRSQEAVIHTRMNHGYDSDLLRNMHPAIRCRLIRDMLVQYLGDVQDIEMEQIERISNAIESGEDFSINLPFLRLPSGTASSARMVSRNRRVTIEAIRRRSPGPTFDVALAVPGEVWLDEVGVTVKCSLNQVQGKLLVSPGADRFESECEAIVDASSIVGTLRARNWRPGDRMRPLGMTGTKKLQDIFKDKKLPRIRRDNAVVVADDEKIVWVAGVAVSEDARLTEETAEAIRIVAEEASTQ